jgi:DNA ligase (NAD+)
MCPDHPYLDEVGSPTPDGSVWPKFTHSQVMGSLFKVNNEADFRKWGRKKGKTFFLSEKADGCTIVAYYEEGQLVTLATRGDGTIGEDITPNARYVQNVRLRLPGKFTGILRGEGLLYLDDFQKHFAPLGTANPRNGASGKVRDTKNPHLKRHIVVKWFDIISDDVDFLTWEDKFTFIETDLGLDTISWYGNLSLDDVWGWYDRYVQHQRKNLNYWIDGLVTRVSNLKQHDSFGVTDKRPKGSIAIKFPAVGVESVLQNIEFSRGRSGRIAPVGLIKPVLIDGTTVGRVSLHGSDWIEQMGLQIGDIVEVAKAGDIIPQIIKRIKPGKKPKPIIFPTTCPECSIKLVKNGAYIECQNKSCDGETYGAIAKWLEKTGIKGIGDSILQELIKEVKDVAGLYESDAQVFARAARGSDKLGKKIYRAIQGTRSLSLAVFLSGLHIDSLGTTNGQRIAGRFKTLDSVMSASEADFRKIPGISQNAAKIASGLNRKRILILKLQHLLDVEDVSEGVFTDLSFCITGKLSRKRSEIETWIKSHGGVCKGIGKDLSYLVTNTPDSGSSKNQKADKYGVKKITEDELYALVDDGPKDPTPRAIKASPKAPRTAKKKRAGTKKRFDIKGSSTSLFDDVFGNDRAWIDVVEGKPGKFHITGSSLLEDGEPSKVKGRLGFTAWDSDVEDLDGGASPQSSKLNISSHLKRDKVELMEKLILADNWKDVRRSIQKVTFTSWSEGDL